MCHNFHQSNTPPSSDTKFKVHDELQKESCIDSVQQIQDLDEHKSFQTSRLTVVGTGQEWIINETNLQHYNFTHFIAAPRKHMKLQTVDKRWRNPKLVDTLSDIRDKVTLLVLMLPVSSSDCLLWQNPQIWPYFTWDQEIRRESKPQTSVPAFRKKLMKTYTNAAYETVEGLNELPRLATNKFIQNSSNGVMCLVHLHLTKDYDITYINTNNQDLILAQSNLFLVLTFGDGKLLETLIVTNLHKWMTLMDISIKKDAIESEPYNLNIPSHVKQYYSSPDIIQASEVTRQSNASLNDLFEFEALLAEYVRDITGYNQLGSSQTITNAALYFIVNGYYNSCFKSLFDVESMEGFDKLYYDNSHRFLNHVQRYYQSKHKFVGQYVFSEISLNASVCDGTDASLWQKHSRKLSRFIMMDKGGQCHWWLPQNLYYNHYQVTAADHALMASLQTRIQELTSLVKTNEKQTKELNEKQKDLNDLTRTMTDKNHHKQSIDGYMHNLTHDFPMTLTPKDVDVTLFLNLLQQSMPQHVQNQWLLSILVGDHVKCMNMHRCNLYNELQFKAGFELLFVINCDDVEAKCTVYVNDCVVQCDSWITGLQLHQNTQSDNERCVVIRNATENTMCVLFRRIPTVVECKSIPHLNLVQ